MALGDLASVRVHFQTNSLIWECAFGMQCISPFVNWRTLLAAEFRSTIMPDWLPWMSQQAELSEIVVDDVYPATGAPAVWTPTTSTRGAVPFDMAPTNVAACVSWRSEGVGRNTRGRNYFAGFVAAAVYEGYKLHPELKDRLLTLATTMFAQYGATGFSELARFIVISRGPKSAPLAVPQAFPLISAVIPNYAATQRRRAFS